MLKFELIKYERKKERQRVIVVLEHPITVPPTQPRENTCRSSLY